MPRKPKQGIDFAGWSVNMFDGDKKIDKLLDAQGWKGFGVYFFLCQSAYKLNGYYLEWGYDDSATTARRMGGGVTSTTVEETVRFCLLTGLFDEVLFDRWNVLTSKGIQRRFWVVAGERRVVPIHKKYWLLSPEEAEGLGKIARFDDLSPTNSDLQPTNSDLQPRNVHRTIVDGTIVSSGGSNARAREDELGRVMGFYLDHFPLPSENVRDGLRDYTELLSADVVLHVLQYAIDEHKTGWGYILTILQRYHRDGLTTIGAVEEDERRYKAKKQTGTQRRAKPQKRSFLDMYKEAVNSDEK